MINTVPDTAMQFERFVVPHLDAMRRVACSMCRSTHDAEDLVQDTLIRAFRGLDSFDGRHPWAWLLTIMRNASVNGHRRRRPGLLPDMGDGPYELERRQPPSPSAEDEATATAPPAWIAEALATLSHPHLQVVQLVDIDGLTFDEAAAALGIPAGTVMSRLHRARCRIRARIERQPGAGPSHGAASGAH